MKLPIKLPKINTKEIINKIKYTILNFKQLEPKKKLLILIALVVVIVSLVGLIIVIPKLRSSAKIKAGEKAQEVIKDVSVIIPPGAYTYPKSFIIKQIPTDSLEYQNLKNLANFYGKIYDIIPEDGKDESSLVPMKLRYKIPGNLYLGDNYNNLSIAYVTSGDPPVVNEFAGCKVIKENGIYYIEAETFHFSRIGLIVKKGEEVTYGLKKLVDRPPSIKHDIIIVPGADPDFKGQIPNVVTTEKMFSNNLWASLFPDRTIWIYEYPMIETRPKSYMDAYYSFLIRTGSPSYLEFEAKRFATEVRMRPNRTFDVIAQGIGGLIVRYAIESQPNLLKNIKNVILISTPNRGTNIVNPVYFNMIYGKPPDLIEKTYGLDEKTFYSVYFNVSFYLEQVNTFYRDILPDSEILKKLNSFGRRKDVNYFVIVGTLPNIKKEFAQSTLSKFYPELVEGKGDGVVTVESAIIDVAKKMLKVKKSFWEIYSDPSVLDFIKKTLEEFNPKITIPKLESDQYVETKEELKKFEKKLEEEKKKKEPVFILPHTYESTKLIAIDPSQLFYTNLFRFVKVIPLEGNFLIFAGDKIMNPDGTILLKGNLLGDFYFDNKYFVVKNDGVYTIDPTIKQFFKIRDMKFENVDEVYYLPEIRHIIKIQNLGSVLNIYDGDEMLTTTSAFVGIKYMDEKYFIITKEKVLYFYSGEWKELFNINEINNNTKVKIDAIKDFVYTKDYYLILTYDYRLIMFTSEKDYAQVVCNGDIGRKAIVLVGNNLYIFGERNVALLDIKNRIWTGLYQEFKYPLFSVSYENKTKTFYFVFKVNGGFEVKRGTIK